MAQTSCGLSPAMNIQGSVPVNNLELVHTATMQSVRCAMIRRCNCRWLPALKLNEIAPDVRSSSNTTRHVAREKSCAIAFLFPHALYFCVHGILAHSLLISWLLRLCKPLLKRRRELLRYHRSQLAAGVVAWSGTHDVLVLSRKPGPSA